MVDLGEWIAYIEKEASRGAAGPKVVKKLLAVFAKQIGEEKTFSAPASSTEEDAAAARMQATMRAKNARAVNKDYVLSEELKAEAERVFKLADTDGNGTLDQAEMSNLRNSPEMAGKMMQSVDMDKSGSIELSEWLTYITEQAAKGAAGPKVAVKLLAVYAKQLGAG